MGSHQILGHTHLMNALKTASLRQVCLHLAQTRALRMEMESSFVRAFVIHQQYMQIASKWKVMPLICISLVSFPRLRNTVFPTNVAWQCKIKL